MKESESPKDPLAGNPETRRKQFNHLVGWEVTLEGTERIYQTLVTRSPTGIYIILDRQFVYVNPQFQIYTGFTEDELLAMNTWELVHPDDRDEVRKNALAMLKGKRTSPYEFRTFMKSGDIIWTVGTVASVQYMGKRATLGNFVDITDRKKAEDALQESEEKYRSLFEEGNDAIFLIDANTGLITDANREAERLLGYSTHEIIGMHQSQLHPTDQADYYSDKFKMLLEVEPATDFETDVIRRDGTIVPVFISASVIQLRGGRLVQTIFRDITERKRMEKRLRELYEEEKTLRQELEEEMESRIEFTRVLVHELKTPLTSVLASSELLVAQLKEDTSLALAKNINRGASNLNTRIDELLDLAKVETGMLQMKLEPVDLLPLLFAVHDEMAPVISGRTQLLTLELPASLPSVNADENRLRQVVLNLLINAFKFTPEGGTITLRARATATSVVVEVQDTGPGISKENQKRLFEPYHRLENDRERLDGLGLGLALCKTLVDLHGGRIWIESIVGKGSTFSFSLPLKVSGHRTKSTKRRIW